MNILVKQLQEQFNQAQPQGAGKLSPRNGYFYVIKTYIKEREHKEIIQLIPTAKVNWRPEAERDIAFLEDAVFEIAVSSLHVDDREEQTPDYAKLQQKVLYIHDTKVVNKIHNGQPRPTVTCKWHILETKPTFKNGSSLTMESFLGNASTLNDVANNFEDGDAEDGMAYHDEPPEDK